MRNLYVKPCLNDQQWMGDAWEEGVDLASKESAVADFPEYPSMDGKADFGCRVLSRLNYNWHYGSY